MSEVVVKKRGGYRPNAGRKPKYSEETQVLTVRIPKSMIKDIRKTIPILIDHPKIMQMVIEGYEEATM